MNRQNQILAAILVVQIVILAIVYWPETSVAEGQRLFEGLEVDQIVKLGIRGLGDQQIQMAKGPDGWVLPEADDYPIQEGKVQAFLEKMLGVRADRLVTGTRESHKRLQVAEEAFERLIEFELEDGTQRKLYLGSAPRYQVIHVRADDQDEVYLALGLSASDAGAGVSNWIDTNYFSVPQDELVAITLENGNGRFEFEKDEAGNWTMINLPAGETLLENNVRSLATRVSLLRMQRPLGREEEAAYGLDDPSASFTLSTRDETGNERTHIVRIGASPEGEQGFVVKSAASPYYALMAEFTVKDLIERTVQDFIEVPPTPVPETEETPTPTP
jgi:hypothetical protein